MLFIVLYLFLFTCAILMGSCQVIGRSDSNKLYNSVVHRNKDTLLSQAAAHRASMNRNAPATIKSTSSEKAHTEESTPVVASTSADTASTAVGEVLSSSSAPSAPKKPHAIVVSMSTSTIPIDVSILHMFLCYIYFCCCTCILFYTNICFLFKLHCLRLLLIMILARRSFATIRSDQRTKRDRKTASLLLQVAVNIKSLL